MLAGKNEILRRINSESIIWNIEILFEMSMIDPKIELID